MTWPADAPAVGMHLGVAAGLTQAARRARQIGCTALQIFSDNPTAWRRRAEPPPDAPAFVAYCERHGIAPISIHASYLVNLAGSAEPFATQSREVLRHELERAPQYGATLVNTHIGSHRGDGREAGLRRVADAACDILAGAPDGVRLVLENSAGGGDTVGATLEELAAILDMARAGAERLAFCLDTAHLWGAGYDVSGGEGVDALVERFDELIGLERLVMVHLNDSRSEHGSRSDRHEHLGAGRIGAEGMGAMLRHPRLRQTTFIMETPGVDEGWDAANLRRAWLLYQGAEALPTLPPAAFRTSRRSTRVAPGGAAGRVGAAGRGRTGGPRGTAGQGRTGRPVAD